MPLLSLVLSAVAASLPAAEEPRGERGPADAVAARTPAEPALPASVDELAERLSPWIVSIRVRRSDDVEGDGIEELLRRRSREAREYFRRPEGWVTGLLVSREGLVLTSAYNVVGELESVEVRLPGGEVREARVLGRSRPDDVALIAVEGDETAVADGAWHEPPWASAAPDAGRIVFALGRSPDPEHLTVTQGIVSASGRNGDRGFQIDAELNYGNVGGPVVGLRGRILGVSGFVGHLWPQWGQNSGIGFATTAPTLRALVPRLREEGDVEPPPLPFLGVRSEVRAPPEQGALVEEVLDGTAAAEAGLEDGDVIVELDGQPVLHFQQLRHLLSEREVEDRVTVRVRRGEEVLELEIVLGERPDGI